MSPVTARVASAGVRWSLALVSLLWLAFSAAGIALGYALGDTTLSGLLPGARRWELMSWELQLLAAVVALLVCGALIAESLAASGESRHSPRHRAGWPFRIVLGGAALLYGGSWLSFVSIGRFLDADGVAFMTMSPLQFAQHAFHIDPLLVLATPLLAIAGVWALAFAAPRLVARVGAPGQWALIALALIGVSACVYQSPGEPSLARAVESGMRLKQGVIDPQAGLVDSHGDLFIASRDDRSGPLSHLWADWRGDLGGITPRFADESIAVTRRPLISMDDYVAGVDRNQMKRWNVIVAVVESLRNDQLESFGGSREVMPRVDALARSGLRFPDHYTQASHSNYADLCILSSHYPLRSTSVHLYPENPTYPRVLIYDVLHALGWHTAVISSQNENWGRMINYLRTGGIDHFFHSETFRGPTYVPRNDTGFVEFLKGGKRSGKIDDRFTVDEAMRWIESLPKPDPFFIYLNLQNSPLPYETPADFPHKYGPDEVGFTIRFGGYPKQAIPIVRNIYADSLVYVDYQLGRLFDFLRERGVSERTLIVVTGDTGQAFYEHGFVAHANRVFNEVMLVPLVLHGPGISPGVDSRPAQHIDVPPTILDALSLPPHPAFQGVSLLAPDPDPARSRYLMAQSPLAHQYAVVREGVKLFYDVRRDQTLMVDLVQDPAERKNLATSQPEKAEALRARLDAWRAHQLDYYRDPREQARSYPPVLDD